MCERANCSKDARVAIHWLATHFYGDEAVHEERVCGECEWDTLMAIEDLPDARHVAVVEI